MQHDFSYDAPMILLLTVGIVAAYLLYQEFSGGSISGNLSASQIATYAQNAGFSGVDLVTAVAIALAESGGNPQAYNPETKAGAAPGQGSYGLWQIYLTAHPEDAGSNLYDPQTNANEAYAIYAAAGGSFRAWSTFLSNAYQSFVSTVQGAISA